MKARPSLGLQNLPIFIALWSYVGATNYLKHISVDSRRNVGTCDKNITCPASSTCIPFEAICDGKSDCPADWDELLCENGRDCRVKSCSHTCEVLNGTATCQCPTGFELENDRVCFDVNECLESLHLCEQICHNTEGSYYCSCYKGFVLDEDGHTCNDTDECLLSTPVCSHKCTNTYGAYECSCFQGYTLHEDGSSCRASRRSETKIIYTTKDEMRGYLIQTGDEYLLRKPNVYASAPIFDKRNSTFYWLEKYFDGGAVIKSDSKSLEIQTENKIVHRFSCPQDIAIDVLNSKLYVTDICSPAIIACELHSEICSSIITENTEKPGSIIVDPKYGWMYWIDWGPNNGIRRAGMDGSRHKMLIIASLTHSSDLTLDSITKTLYWTNLASGIEAYSLATNERKAIHKLTGAEPVFISVFEDDIYFTSMMDNNVRSCNKDECNALNETETVTKASETITGTYFYHPLLELTGVNPCENHSCSHLCLLSPKNGFRCKCPDNMIAEASAPNICVDLKEPEIECLSPSLLCPNRKCISNSSICDGVNDCGDNHDELFSNCSKNKTNEAEQQPPTQEEALQKLKRGVHKQMKKITEAIENLEKGQSEVLRALSFANISIEI